MEGSEERGMWRAIARIGIVVGIIAAVLGSIVATITILGMIHGGSGGGSASTPTATTSATATPSPTPEPSPTPTSTPTRTPTPKPTSGSQPSHTYPETTGGVTHTWTNYTNAGGTEGQTVPAYATIQVACKVTGFKVQDGNTWWYRIAESPWSNHYYASADAFYNNGQTSGPLSSGPFVDPAVPDC